MYVVTFNLITERVLVKYENGEVETVTIVQTEPDEDFSPLMDGTTVCVKTRGGRYFMEANEVTDVTITKVWNSSTSMNKGIFAHTHKQFILKRASLDLIL